MEDQSAAKEGPGALDPLTPTMAREIKLWPLDELAPYARNARTHSAEQVQQIAASIMEFGFVNPVLVARGTIRAGHGRVLAAQLLGLAEVPVVELDHLTEVQARAFTLADNRLGELAGWDDELLAAELAELAAAGTDLAVLGFSDAELAQLAADLDDPSGAAPAAGSEREPKVKPEDAPGVLARRFGVPPFSVLDSKQGYWQERKAAWLALGIRSEVGRDSNLLGMSETVLGSGAAGDPAAAAGTSVFDPVLCELAYRWWCPEGGRILDPFAGGSVRGIVAAHLGFTYCGIELRQEQVSANEEQAERILGAGWELKVQWICGDSANLGSLLEGVPPFDFLFTCPPYYDLEKYSSSPEDLSNAPTYDAFLESYRAILAAAVSHLADGRFACLIVSDLRSGPGRSGNLYGFERDTQNAMEDAGAALYNLAVLTQPVGTLPIRAGRIFGAGRKLPRNHQAVQVFAKGDAAAVTRELLGPTEWDTIESSEGAGLAELGLEPLVVDPSAELAAEFGDVLEGSSDPHGTAEADS